MNKVIQKKLEDTFNDVTDLTALESLDRVLMIYEQCRVEDEEYMKLLVDKLKNEKITWELPHYQRNYSITRRTIQGRDGDDECDMGSLTVQETQLIEQNWQQFIQKYNVPDTPLHLARWKNRGKYSKRNPEEKVRHFVAAYLGRGLQRYLYQVNKYFILRYGNPVKSRRLSYIDERVMEICFYHRPHDAVIILKDVLGRESRWLYKKLIDYYHGKLEKKIKLKWTLELASKIVHLLMEYSGSKFEELKNIEFDKSLWLKVQEKIGLPYKYIQEFWYTTLHVQLFVKCSVKTKSLQEMICNSLQQSPYQKWTDIQWKELVLRFPEGFTSWFLYKMAHRMFRVYPQYLSRPLPGLLAAAAGNRRRWTRKQLKTIQLTKNGNLAYINYDKSLNAFF